MAIEFRCHNCGKLLRTEPANAGRRSICPKCRETLTVPPPLAEAGESASLDDAESEASFSTAPASGTAPPRHISAAQARMSPTARHRGGLILAFGILAWVTCTLFGVAAWVMAVDDLRAMRSGEMDASGESLTRTGMYLGIANVVLVAVSILGITAVAVLTVFLA